MKKNSLKKFISTSASVALVATAMTPVVAAENVKIFTDLKPSNFGYEEVMSLTSEKIIDGYNDGSFRPGTNVTREQTAKLIVNALGKTGDENLPKYNDVSSTSPWMDYLDAAYDANIIRGYSDKKFGFNEELTREQMASILVRSFNLKTKESVEVNLKDLTEASVTHKADIETLYQNGITLGFLDGTFQPKESVSRVDFSVFLHRALNMPSDSNTISSFTTNNVTIGNKTYTFDSVLKGLFSESNVAALKGAEVEFTEEEGKLTSIKSLKIVSSGNKADKVEFDNNVVLDLKGISLLNDLVIEGDYVTLKNGTINGNLVIDQSVHNDFYSDGITVNGKTIISGGDDNTVVFDNATLENVEINKLDVRVELLGTSTVGDVSVNNNAQIHSDSDRLLNKVILSDKVTNLKLNTKVKELVFTGLQKVDLVGLKSVDKVTLPANLKLEDVLLNYNEIRSIFSKPSTGGGSTSPSPSTPRPNQSVALTLDKVSVEESTKKVLIAGLTTGSIVKVYNSSSATNPSVQGSATSSSLELDIASFFDVNGGSVWVSVQKAGETESTRLNVVYEGNDTDLDVELSAAGTYGGTADNVKVYEGNVVVTSADVVLENAIIKGNLTIAASVAEGDATFNGVTVEGETIIEGGGANSVYFTDSVLLTVIVNKNNGSVRVVAQGSTQVREVLLESGAKLDEENMTGDAAGFTNVEITEAVQNSTGSVILDGSFETVNSRANNVRVELTGETTLNDLVLSALAFVLGTGAIQNLTVTGSAGGSTVAQSPQSVVLDIDGNVTVGGDEISESYSIVDHTSLESIEATMSYVRVDLAEPKVDLTADDFIVTATINEEEVTLNDLEYLPTRRMFTFTPIALTQENIGKEMTITVSPISATEGENPDSREVIGESKSSTFTVSTGFSGRITDTYGRGIEGLTVAFPENLRTETDRNGYYFIEAEPGVYEGTISGAGYINTNILATVTDNSFTTGVNETAIRASSSNEMKIMLSWNGMESDVDSHLATSNFHVYYGDTIHGEDEDGDGSIETEYVDLDWDDTDYFGPETTTIREWQDGRYVFFIHNYSGQNPLSESESKVQIYQGNSTEANYSFDVPDNTEDARYWGAFELQVSNNGETVEVNELNILADNEEWLIDPKGSLEDVIADAEEMITYPEVPEEIVDTITTTVSAAKIVLENEAATTAEYVSEIKKINEVMSQIDHEGEENDQTAPSPVTNFVVTSEADRVVNLSWNWEENSDTDFAEYVVYYAPGGDFTKDSLPENHGLFTNVLANDTSLTIHQNSDESYVLDEGQYTFVIYVKDSSDNYSEGISKTVNVADSQTEDNTAPTVVNGEETQTGTAVPASIDGSTTAVSYTADISAWFTDVDTEDVLGYSFVSATDEDGNDVIGNVTLGANGPISEVEYIPEATEASQEVTIIVKANDGTLDSDYVTITITVGMVPGSDLVPPTLSDVTSNQVTIGEEVSATSNEDGTLYLVPKATPKLVEQIELLSTSEQGNKKYGAKVDVTNGVPAFINTTGFSSGDYVLYMVDAKGNITNPIDIVVGMSDITPPNIAEMGRFGVWSNDQSSIELNVNANENVFGYYIVIPYSESYNYYPDDMKQGIINSDINALKSGFFRLSENTQETITITGLEQNTRYSLEMFLEDYSGNKSNGHSFSPTTQNP